MTINLTGTAKDNDPLAVTREVERALSRLTRQPGAEGCPCARGGSHRRGGLLDTS
jgi:hypothetical protein